MVVFDAALWAVELALEVTIENRETLQSHAGNMLAIFSDSQTAIGRAALLELATG
jgi:hypothetical protein